MASFSQLINQNVPVLVDFKADWCQPCKMMAPVLKQVKNNFKDQIKIIKIDIDKIRKAKLYDYEEVEE